MNRLSNLVTEIKKDQKLPVDEILNILSESIYNEKDCTETYKKLYIKAYGKHLNDGTCKDWANSLSGGPKWTLEQTSDVGNHIGMDWSKISKYEFWAVMNAFYCDYLRTGKKYELQDEPEFFADIVKDTFNDEDAHDKTVMTYYMTFVA